MKYLFLAMLSLGSVYAFSQQSIKISDLRPGKDTVYVGIANKLFLKSSGNVMAVKSDQAFVRIMNDSLIVMPKIPGKIKIDIIYKESVQSRSYVAVFLPDPGNKSKSN